QTDDHCAVTRRGHPHSQATQRARELAASAAILRDAELKASAVWRRLQRTIDAERRRLHRERQRAEGGLYANQQRHLDRFATYYNNVRPHRGVGRRTPAEVFAAREKAYPRGPKID